MKRNILVICILTLSVPSAIAQRGLYFNPVFRNGVSSSQQIDLNTSQYEANSVYTYGADIGIGYSINKLRIQTAIGYLRSGYSYDIPSLNNTTSVFNQYFNHLTGTLQLGYVFRNNKRLAIVPYIGASYAFNYSARTVSRLNDGSVIKKKIKDATFKNQYEQNSILANIKVHFEYRFAQSAALIFGPSFQYMVTNMSKTSVLLTGSSELKNHNGFLDIGIIWILPDKSKSGKNRMPSLFYN